jgi:hypothetical protein
MQLDYNTIINNLETMSKTKLFIISKDNLKELKKSISIIHLENNLYQIYNTEIYIFISMYAPDNRIINGF